MENAATILVTYDSIKQALGIPQEVELLAVVQEPGDVLRRTVQLLVKHESLPACHEGAVPVTVTIEKARELVNNG